MSEELRELLDAINAKKQEVRDLCSEGKLEDAVNAKNELKAMQEKFNLLYDLDTKEQEEAKKNIEAGNAQALGEKKDVQTAFVNALKAAAGKGALEESDRQILNAMSEGSDPDGGLTVPQDIRTAVRELRRTEDALEPLVNVEHVTTLSGSRVLEKYADSTPFDNVDEAAEFPEVSTPQFELMDYKVKKKGGILKVTQELLDDSAENIIGFLKKWIARKAKATRNFMIISKIKEITKDNEITVDSLDDLKAIFNITLDPAIAATSRIVTNQDGYNWLDSLKDKDGRYILQPDPTKPLSTLLFGRYPVHKISNRVLASTKTDDGIKVPIICGDLKEAITIFDRETLSVDMSKVAGDLWKTDQTGFKVRERLDIQTVDGEAIIMAEHLLPGSKTPESETSGSKTPESSTSGK